MTIAGKLLKGAGNLLKKVAPGIVKTAGNIAGNLLPVGGGVVKTVTSAIANKMLPTVKTVSAPIAPVSAIQTKLTQNIGAGAGTASTGAATIKKVSATPVSINPPTTKKQDKIFGAPPKPILSEITYFDSPTSLVNMNTSSSTTDPDQSKEKSKVMIWIAAGAAFLLLVGSLLFGRKT